MGTGVVSPVDNGESTGKLTASIGQTVSGHQIQSSPPEDQISESIWTPNSHRTQWDLHTYGLMKPLWLKPSLCHTDASQVQGGPLSWAPFARPWPWVHLAASLDPWPWVAGSWNTVSSPQGGKRERLDLSLRLQVGVCKQSVPQAAGHRPEGSLGFNANPFPS